MKTHWILIILLAVLLALLGSVYALGYRVGPGLSIVTTHTLTVADLYPGATVYADLTPRGTVASSTSAFSLELTPGAHSILVSADGYLPWEGLVTVPEDNDVRVAALLIPTPENIKPTEIVGTALANAQKLINAAKLPAASTALPMLGGCVSVFVSSNRVLAEPSPGPSCATIPYLASDASSTPTVIFSPVDTLGSVVSYPGRDDALIVTAGTQVYALALDPRTPRAFAPLIRGVAPLLVEEADGTLLIADAGHVYSLTLSTPR